MKHKFKNAKGKYPHPKTIPADTKQCQAFPNQIGWSFMSMGPRPKPIRCPAEPVVVVVENTPNPQDKRIGSMSLCETCLELFFKEMPVKEVTLHRLRKS